MSNMSSFRVFRCLALGFLLPLDATARSLQRAPPVSWAGNTSAMPLTREGMELAGRRMTVGLGGFEDGFDGDDDEGFSLHDRHHPEKAVYDHMPKAGGTLLIQLIRAAVGGENFERISEFENLTDETAETEYVIGSVRNPCDYYLSLWAYGVEHGGAMMSHIPDDKRHLYNTTSYWKNSTADIRHFRNWVRMINKRGHPGIMSVRMARSYADMDMDIVAQIPPFSLDDASLDSVERALSNQDYLHRVDCWVNAENLDKDTRRCLHRWSDANDVQLHWNAYKKAWSGGFAKASAHGQCSDYFDDDLEAQVRAAEGPIFRDFEYKTCCAPEP